MPSLCEEARPERNGSLPCLCRAFSSMSGWKAHSWGRQIRKTYSLCWVYEGLATCQSSFLSLSNNFFNKKTPPLKKKKHIKNGLKTVCKFEMNYFIVKSWSLW